MSLAKSPESSLDGCILEDVRALGWREVEGVRGDGSVRLQVGEAQQRVPAELVEELHRREGLALEAEAHALEARVRGPGRRLDPRIAVARARVAQREERGDVVPAREERR